MAHGLRLNSIAESAPLEALRRRKVSCAPLPERHPGPSNSVKNPTSAPLGELPPAVAHFSCSPLGMLGHNQPDEFRTHGVAGRPVLTDLPTTATAREGADLRGGESRFRRSRCLATYAQVGCAGSTADKHHHRDLPSTRVRCGPACAATNMCAAAEEPGEGAAGPNPEPGHSPRPAFPQALPRTRLEELLWAAMRSVTPGSCLRSLTVTHSGGT